MNQHLQNILDLAAQSDALTEEQANELSSLVKKADKELTISEFKLDRTEKVKRTTAILLEETIQELEQKREAVEAQNRELEVEGALERVRAAAMSMHTTDELKQVGEIIFEELKTLGFADLRNTEILINDDENESVLSHYYSDYGVSGTIRISTSSHPVVKKWAEEMKKAGDAFAEVIIPEDEMADWKKYREEIGYVPDPKLDDAKRVYYYSYSTGLGALSISAFSPITEAQTRTLARFRNVFALAYRRYVDVAKAEAQTREAEIELGLERVRARAMAMQTSEELSELVDTVFKELKKLDLALSWCIINITDGDAMTNTLWSAHPEFDRPECYRMKFEDYRFHHELLKAWRERKTKWVFVMEGPDKDAYMDYLFSETELSSVPGSLQQEMRTTKRYYHSYSFSNFGGLQTVGEEPLSEANLNILARFGKVFDLTYTRFNDLQNAEAQAREAQIEAALERTRTQSMLMQHSDELKTVSNSFHEQLLLLGLPSEFSYVWLPDEPNDEHQFWASWAEDVNGETQFKSKSVTWPLDKTEPYTAACFAMWESEEPVHVKPIPPDEVETFFDTWEELLSGAENLKAELFPDGLYYAEAYMKYGCFGINIRRPLSEEEQQILRRFAVEFERAYTRFLDLKKAEAQAREARIEAALERVRSRTMGMHKSNELLEAGALLFKELSTLGVEKLTCGYVLMDDEAKVGWNYGVNPGDGTVRPQPTGIPQSGTKVLESITKSWKKQEPFYFIQLDTQDTIDHQTYIAENSLNFTLTKEQLLALSPERLAIYTFNFKHGYLMLVGGVQLTAGQQEIVARFAKVFEMTYRRFLDLEMAEAQAREAQIEAALERVRARSMAMHKSEELADLSLELVKQVQKLGIETWFCAFNIYDDDEKGSLEWGSNGQGVFPKYRTPREGIFLRYYEAGQKGETLFVHEIGEAECPAHYDYLCGLPGVGEQLLKMKEAGIPFPTYQIDHAAFFKYGYVLFITFEPVPEAHEVFKRFAKVFEQTYTRFLDLQKAEAQTRETQIELALERVRAQATAMKESSDLLDIVVTMRHEFVSLGHEAHYFWHMRWLPDIYEKAMTSGDGSRIGNVMSLPRSIHGEIPKIAEWEKGAEPTVVYDMDADTAIEYVDKMISMGDFERIDPNAPTPDDIRHIEGLTFVMARTTHGEIGYSLPGMVPEPPQEDLDTLVRFAGVFDLAYRRFEDLLQAEARAREAEQQASLDRVRAEIASMRTAEDLERITPLIWRELTSLDVPFYRCGVFIVDLEAELAHAYLSTPEGASLAALDLKFDSAPFVASAVGQWQKEEMYREEWSRKQFVDWTKSIVEKGLASSVGQYQGGTEVPEKLVLQFIPFTQGMLYIGSAQLLSEEEIGIGQALAKAFGVAYARYEDFKRLEEAKAEVEAALKELEALSKELEAKNKALEKTLEQELALEKERQLNDRLRQLDKLKDEFLANTSHELRTPLHGIIGLAESLVAGAAGEPTEDMRQNLSMIIASGRRLTSLVNDILDFSKLKRQDLQLQRKPIDICVLTDIVLKFSEPLARGKRLRLVNDIPEDSPPADADENRLQQILHNLIGNAIKFTESGSVTVAAAENDGMIEISVTDTGIGIPADKCEAIFQSFEQGDASTAREYGGAGLGLAITRQLVDLHGGSISVTSKVGEGSTFAFTLPVSDGVPESIGAATTLSTVQESSEIALAESSAKTKARDGDITILVVDDEPVNHQVLANHLSFVNYRVTQAFNGQEALDALESTERFDLVLLDIMMPKMSGYEVCQKIREKYLPGELPVIMVTAKNQVTDLVEGFTSGANDYLAKPFTKDELLARMKTQLNLSKINFAYGRFVPHEFLRYLNRESIIDVQLGDNVEKEMTIFVSDIRSFTTLSEKMSPEENFAFINAYLSQVSPIIREHDGFVDRYSGDGIMALFPTSPEDALRAAIATLKRLNERNAERTNGDDAPIRIGVGLHTGSLMLGIVGERERAQGDIFSDAVNLANRIEGLSKLYGVSIVVSEKTLAGLPDADQYHKRFLGKAQVKGKKEPVSVFEIYDGEPDEVIELKLKTKADFEKGLQHYFAREFTKASVAFQTVLDTYPEDKTAKLYLERSATFMIQGVGGKLGRG